MPKTTREPKPKSTGDRKNLSKTYVKESEINHYVTYGDTVVPKPVDLPTANGADLLPEGKELNLGAFKAPLVNPYDDYVGLLVGDKNPLDDNVRDDSKKMSESDISHWVNTIIEKVGGGDIYCSNENLHTIVSYIRKLVAAVEIALISNEQSAPSSYTSLPLSRKLLKILMLEAAKSIPANLVGAAIPHVFKDEKVKKINDHNNIIESGGSDYDYANYLMLYYISTEFITGMIQRASINSANIHRSGTKDQYVINNQIIAAQAQINADYLKLSDYVVKSSDAKKSGYSKSSKAVSFDDDDY